MSFLLHSHAHRALPRPHVTHEAASSTIDDHLAVLTMTLQSRVCSDMHMVMVPYGSSKLACTDVAHKRGQSSPLWPQQCQGPRAVGGRRHMGLFGRGAGAAFAHPTVTLERPTLGGPSDLFDPFVTQIRMINVPLGIAIQ